MEVSTGGRAASRPIAIRAGKRVVYGEVADVMAACRDAGWQNAERRRPGG